ncbi:MAG: CDP-glycerol glycerophosphotransferase family protein [Alphaproteobacteria bacterium]|nr:CDP-glycerol glycerophosphotransferase family protein [Alphaproteobacteria bacterium]
MLKKIYLLKIYVMFFCLSVCFFTNALAKDMSFQNYNALYTYIDNIFGNIKQNRLNKIKDNYILFDCLYDAEAENIDAYSLFLKMKEKGLNAYYILHKDSNLYNKINDIKYSDSIIAISHSTKKNPIDFINAIKDVIPNTKSVITSFGTESVVDYHLNSINDLEYIFIQHGQIFLKESVFDSGYINPNKFDKILTSSDFEVDLLKKHGWKDEQLLKFGLPRWDLLDNTQNEKSIFIMFTWRQISPSIFAKSLYFKRLSSLLNNKELHSFTEKNNVKIYFAPHHAMKTNSNINLAIKHPNIKMVETHEISKYIKKSSILLTDLSSVAFDFMFQNKPVILYGLDKGDIWLNKAQHRDLELLNIKKDVFPNIFFNEQEVIEKLKYYINNNFKIEPQLITMYDKFFFTRENIRDKIIDSIK